MDVSDGLVCVCVCVCFTASVDTNRKEEGRRFIRQLLTGILYCGKLSNYTQLSHPFCHHAAVNSLFPDPLRLILIDPLNHSPPPLLVALKLKNFFILLYTLFHS